MNKPNNMPNIISSDISSNNIPYSRKVSNAKNRKNQLHLYISKPIFSKNNTSLVVTESNLSGIGISIFENDHEGIKRPVAILEVKSRGGQSSRMNVGLCQICWHNKKHNGLVFIMPA